MIHIDAAPTAPLSPSDKKRLAAITNRWEDTANRRVIPVSHVRVAQAIDGGAYNHHPHVAYAEGRLYVSWSRGVSHEDRPGQHVVFAVSEDVGETWSRVHTLAGPSPGRYGHAVLSNNGIHVYRDRLVAFVGHYDVTELSQLMYFAAGGNTALLAGDRPAYDEVYTQIHVSHDRGASWNRTDREIPASALSLCPSSLPDGRLLYPGHVRYWYTDDPSGLSGWTATGVGGLPADYIESPAHFPRLAQAGVFDPVPCEASWYRLPDGSLHMMHRTDRHRLTVTRSTDRGATWSAPVLTDYTDCANRFHFGTLPDGRIFGLNTPEPTSARTPLVLAVGDDGWTFTHNYILGDDANFLAWMNGMHKYGRYGYPYLTCAGAFGIVAYTVNKEDVWIARFSLNDLQ